MKISVVTPVFNGAQWIEDCIESVAGQTHQDLEHIVIDGASTDGTRQLVEVAAEKFPHVRLYSERDSGIYDAMNKGMSLATGEYILFLGSDDRLAGQTVIADMSAVLDGERVFYGDVVASGRSLNGTPEGGIYGGAFDSARLIKENICHQAIFYPTKLVRRIGKYRTDFRTFADWEYNLRCWAEAEFTHVDVVVSIYNTNGISSRSADIPFLLGFYDSARRTMNLSLFSRHFKSVRSQLALVGRQKLKQQKSVLGLYYLAASAWHHVQYKR